MHDCADTHHDEWYNVDPTPQVCDLRRFFRIGYGAGHLEQGSWYWFDAEITGLTACSEQANGWRSTCSAVSIDKKLFGTCRKCFTIIQMLDC